MRTRRSVDEGKALVEQFKQSGLGQREFTKKHSIPLHTLLYWIRKLRETKQDLRFVEVLDVKKPGEIVFAVSVETGTVALRFNHLPDSAYLVDLAKGLAGC